MNNPPIDIFLICERAISDCRAVFSNYEYHPDNFPGKYELKSEEDGNEWASGRLRRRVKKDFQNWLKDYERARLVSRLIQLDNLYPENPDIEI